MSNVPPIPEGFTTLTPHLIVQGAAQALDFYKAAFGAVEHGRMAAPDGKILHAGFQIENSQFFICDEFPMSPSAKSPATLGAATCFMHLYVEDADAVYTRAVEAGARVLMEIHDAFWGSRYGQVQDPFGQIWSIATQKEILTENEMKERAAKMFSGEGCGGPQ